MQVLLKKSQTLNKFYNYSTIHSKGNTKMLTISSTYKMDMCSITNKRPRNNKLVKIQDGPVPPWERASAETDRPLMFESMTGLFVVRFLFYRLNIHHRFWYRSGIYSRNVWFNTSIWQNVNLRIRSFLVTIKSTWLTACTSHPLSTLPL